MTRYRQYCPVARAAEILADRWTPLIVRELLAGCRHFNEIERGLPGISRSLLSARLRGLEDAGVLRREEGAHAKATTYVLTDAGRALQPVIESFGAWGARFAFGEPRPEELDPALLLWKLHRRVDRAALPPGRVVVEFELELELAPQRKARRRRRLWLVLRRDEVSVCVQPPGFDADLRVTAALPALYAFWVGRCTLREAIAAGDVHVEGATSLVRSLPRWLRASPLAAAVRASVR
jgi:DNA-binding HxlR family transcriptional regulator